MLRQMRQARGWSRRELAERMQEAFPGEEYGKTHPQTIVRLENGSLRFSDHWILPLAAVLEVEPARFYGGGTAPETSPERAAPQLDLTPKAVPATAQLRAVPVEGEGTEVAVLAPPTARLTAWRVEDDEIDHLVPKGGIVVIDSGDVLLVPGRLYAIISDGRRRLRRYGANPERWEAVSHADIGALYPTRSVEVLGRLVRGIVEL